MHEFEQSTEDVRPDSQAQNPEDGGMINNTCVYQLLPVGHENIFTYLI